MATTQSLVVAQLVREIVSRACGVFLWVILAVRSLLEGLRNEDSIRDLLLRLEELPADIEELYRLMWAKTKPLYRQQAAQMFQLCRAHGMQQLRTLTIAFADDDYPDAAVYAPVREMSLDEQERICQAMVRRLNSRCCGLLEVHFLRQYGSGFLPDPCQTMDVF